MPTLAEIHAAIGGDLRGSGDVAIEGVGSLETAGAGDLAPLASKQYADRAAQSKAGALVTPPDLCPALPHIAVEHPLVALNRIIELLGLVRPAPPGGIHPTAVVDPSATVGEGAAVGPHSVVDAEASIGARTRLGPRTVVEQGARIGEDCHFEPGVVVGHGVVIGDRCVVGAHTVIGRQGFGWAKGARGPEQLHHIGTVVLENDVHIGGGCMIDRARFDETRIGAFTALDNMCHIAHNCTIGKYNFLAAQNGFAGMTRTGDGCEFGGQVGIAGQATIGDGAKLGAKTGALQDVPAGAEMWGLPARPKRDFMRAWALLYKMIRKPNRS